MVERTVVVAKGCPSVAVLERLRWGRLDSAILDDYRKFESVGFVEEKERKNLGVEWRSLVDK